MSEEVSGAAQGAAAGSSFGPWGAAIGGLVGLWQGSQAKKAGKTASKEQLRAARDAELLNRERFAMARGYLDPYAGRADIAAQQLQAELGLPQYSTTPYTEFSDPNMGPQQGAFMEPKPEYHDIYRDLTESHSTRYADLQAEKEYQAALEDWQFRQDARKASGP